MAFVACSVRATLPALAICSSSQRRVDSLGRLRVELEIFSSRLHLEWDEYYELLRYLGLGRACHL
jgi:hypothetical protein